MATVVRGIPAAGRCLVMGVVNVTPDSFSDGGAFEDTDAAIKHGLELMRAGADIIDVGGESTRPGASRVTGDEERRRVLPVIAALAESGAMVSVDTMRSTTAAAALAEGARIVNDVSGGLADTALPALVADAHVPYVVMHWRGHSTTMQEQAVYSDVVAEVRSELGRRLDAVLAAGVELEQVILDPGIGFAKTAEHNWTLLAHLDALTELGRPLLVGASRKSFLGSLLSSEGEPRPMGERDDATTAITAICARAGVWGVRVHEARGSADAVRVAAAIAGHS